MIRLREHSTIIVWTVLTLYTIAVVAFTDYAFMREHYVNFGLLGIALLLHFFRRPIGLAATLILLAIGIFAQSAVLPSGFYFKMGFVTLSMINLVLAIFFVIINRNDLFDWFNSAFADKEDDTTT